MITLRDFLREQIGEDWYVSKQPHRTSRYAGRPRVTPRRFEELISEYRDLTGLTEHGEVDWERLGPQLLVQLKALRFCVESPLAESFRPLIQPTLGEVDALVAKADAARHVGRTIRAAA